MAAARWHLDRDGVEYGPFDWDGLQALARTGRLRPTDLVRRDGMPFWLPAYEAREDGGGPAGTGQDAALACPEPAAAAMATPAPVAERRAGEQPPPTPGAERSDAPDSSQRDSSQPGRAETPHSDSRARSQTGPAVLALVLAVGGLFWFGLLLGGAAVALATRALRSGGPSPRPAGRRTALAALLLGAADVAVMTATLLVRLYATMRPAPH